MARFWMNDDQISSAYREAKDRVMQVEILSELNCVSTKDVTNKLVALGAMTEDDAEVTLRRLKEINYEYGVTDEMDERCQKLYDDGYSDTAISQILGVGRYSVFSWRKRHNLPAKNPSKTASGKWIKYRSIK